MKAKIIFFITFAVVFSAMSCFEEMDVRSDDRSGIFDQWSPLITTVNFTHGQMLNRSCVQSACSLSRVNRTLCPAVCAPNPSSFQAMLDGVSSCFNQSICGFNFQNQTLTNLFQLFDIPGFNGSCVLSGANVSVVQQAATFVVISANRSNSVVNYEANITVNYKWRGLMVNCSSNGNTSRGPSKGFLKQIGCFVFGGFNTIANWLNLKCNQTQGANFSGNVEFQSSIFWTTMYTINNNDLDFGDYELVNPAVNATIEGLTGTIPANWLSAVNSSLRSLFSSDYFNNLYYASVYNVAGKLYQYTVVPACNQTTCEARNFEII